MFAVISLGGKQYRVHKGEYLTVDRLAHEPGSTFSPPVLLASSDADVLIDADALAKVTVTARVDEHLLGPKIRVFQYKPKKSTKKARGHRSRLSRITIQDIAVGSPAKKAPAEKAASEKAPAAKAAPEKATAAKATAEKAPPAKAKAEKTPAAKAAPKKAPAKPRAKPTPATDEPATEQEA